MGFHAGLVPENAANIETLIQAGAVAAKAFLCPSGIDEFGHCGEADLRIAMPRLAAVNAHADRSRRNRASDRPDA